MRETSCPCGVVVLQSAAHQSISNCSSSPAAKTALPSLSTICRSVSSLTCNCALLPRFSDARAKLRLSVYKRQHNSRTPTLTADSAMSNSRSTGHWLPSSGACHRVRFTSTRPLPVSTVRLERPLFRLGLFDASRGGGKTRLRGVDPHLQGPLIGLGPQLPHQVTHLHLRSVDHLPVRRVVHRGGNLPQNLTKLRNHLLNERILRHPQKPVHGCSFSLTTPNGAYSYRRPEDLARPCCLFVVGCRLFVACCLLWVVNSERGGSQ